LPELEDFVSLPDFGAGYRFRLPSISIIVFRSYFKTFTSIQNI